MPSHHTTKAAASAVTSSGSLDFDQFTDEMTRLLSQAWGEEVDFMEAEPIGDDGDYIQLPRITFDTSERRISASHKSLDPILFDKFKDPDNPGRFLGRYRMWFDLDLLFTINHATNKQARKLMDDFEEFLSTYKGYFKDRGISDMVFLKESKPTTLDRQSAVVCQRHLLYRLRLERVTVRPISRSIDTVGTNVHPPKPSNHEEQFWEQYNNKVAPKRT